MINIFERHIGTT